MNNALIYKTKATGKSLRKLASIGLTAAVLATSLGASGPALAAPCRNVEFEIDNRTGGEIQINRIRYRDLVSNNKETWRVENLPNRTCNHNRDCDTQGDNLGSLAQPRNNHPLHNFQIEHRHRNGNGGWGEWQWGGPFLEEADDAVVCQHNLVIGPFELNSGNDNITD